VKTRLLGATCVLVCLFAGVFITARQQNVFRARVDVVRVDVLVTQGGRPVVGLDAHDFQVFDNGVPQSVMLATTAGTVTVALVLDTSESVEGGRLRSLIAASRRLVDTLRPGDVASLVTFSERLSLQVAPVHDPATIETALAGIRPRGVTAMWDALFAGLSLVSEGASRSLVLLLTDAGDNASWLTDAQVIDTVKRSNAVVYVVVPATSGGLIDWLAPLRKVASESGGALFTADWRTGLPQLLVGVLEEFRARYLLTFEPTGVRRDDGWHKLEVRLKGSKGRVQARPGYYATQPRSEREK
jgi:Ca-activated chloride channel family protein